jgi:hypothetical protein
LLAAASLFGLHQTASAEEAIVEANPALGTIEARVTAGMAVGGGAGTEVVRMAPIDVGVYGQVAINEEPWVWLQGGIFAELGDRAAVGGSLGPRIRLGGDWRAGVAGVGIIAPYTLAGASGWLGRPIHFGGAALLPGVEVVAYVIGSDLPEDRVATQIGFTLGVEIGSWRSSSSAASASPSA